MCNHVLATFIITLRLFVCGSLPALQEPTTSTNSDLTNEGFIKRLENLDKAWAKEYWKIERLAKSSDLIVVAEFLETLNLKSDDAVADEFGKEYGSAVPVESRFRVCTILKNDINFNRSSSIVKFFHYSWKEPHYSFNAPRLLRFDRASGDPGCAELVVPALNQQRYLLFLKRTENAVLTPVSSQFHPTLSVRRLSEVQ